MGSVFEICKGKVLVHNLISWIVTTLNVAALAAFVVYLFAVHRLPEFRRPPVPTYDRFGELLGDVENPGTAIAPGREGDPIENRLPNNSDVA